MNRTHHKLQFINGINTIINVYINGISKQTDITVLNFKCTVECKEQKIVCVHHLIERFNVSIDRHTSFNQEHN